MRTYAVIYADPRPSRTNLEYIANSYEKCMNYLEGIYQQWIEDNELNEGFSFEGWLENTNEYIIDSVEEWDVDLK